MGGDNQDLADSGSGSDDWLIESEDPAGAASEHEQEAPEPAATRLFSPADDRPSRPPVVNLLEEIGVPVYVGASANVLREIRQTHCLGRAPGSVLREHIARRDGSAALLHAGCWRVVPCTSHEEALDFQAYLVQRLQPLLNRPNETWRREYSVLYHRFVQELYASEAIGCDELEGRFMGPGVYVYYHTDRSFWQPVAETGQSERPSEFRLLKQAIALSRDGRRQPAREILGRVISANPCNELAWLWYAYNLEHNADRIEALRECLRHNPECKEAKDRLIYLETTEALRHRVQEHRGEIEDQVADAKARLQALQRTLVQSERFARQAREAYEKAESRSDETRRQIAQIEAELVQLREQLEEL